MSGNVEVDATAEDVEGLVSTIGSLTIETGIGAGIGSGIGTGGMLAASRRTAGVH